MKVFIFDSEKCNGCLNCQFACKDEFVDNDWRPYSAPAADAEQPWCHIEAIERGSVPKVRVSHILHICQHCDDCALLAAAPDAVQRRDDGLIIIDPDKAQGRKDLVELCPYGAVYWNEEFDIPQKCTGCAHLLDDGWRGPRCVDACFMGALRFGDVEDFADEIKDAEAIEPVTDRGSHVYYLNLPKRFIAGTVVDIDADEVVIGSTVTLENKATGEVVAVATDDFGDFWFKQIPAGEYNVYFEADGYLTRMVTTSTVEKDQNLGDIALFKQA